MGKKSGGIDMTWEEFSRSEKRMDLELKGHYYCDHCHKFMHKILAWVSDYYGTMDWVCIKCCPIKLSDFDRMWNEMTNPYKEETTKKHLKDFRSLLRKMEKHPVLLDRLCREALT